MELPNVGEHRIAVELMVNGEKRLVRGLATVEPTSGMLRIEVTEETGDFQIILPAEVWKNQIVECHEADCQLLIRLHSDRAQVPR